MNSEQEAEAQEIALIAIGLDREECEAYLRQRTAGEPEVLAEVRRRLELASRIPDGFLDRPAVELQGGREDEAVDLPGGAGPAEPAAGSELRELPFAEGRRYRLGGVVGAGGMAVVLRAFDRRLARPVAIKRLRYALTEDPKALKRFEREARATASVNHPAVVQVFDVLRDGDDLWIIMELVPGQSLADRLAEEPLQLGEALTLAVDVAGGLAAAHALGLVHRDLKAANVMVTPEGRGKILDFGLARSMSSDDDSLTPSSGLCGTPAAMSPEQVNRCRVDFRSDLFSFGTLLYRMVTGSSPFTGSSPLVSLERVCHLRPPAARQLNPRVPEELSALIEALLEKDPDRRPEDTAAVAATLARLAESTPGAAATWRRRGGLPADTASGAFPSASAERRQVTVLSCQLMVSGSGSPLDAEELLQIERSFRSLAVSILERCHAHLGERLDGGLTAYFGFPRAREHDPPRAVSAARAVTAAVERRCTGVSLRTGVHSGPVVVTTRPEERREIVLGRTGFCAAEIKMAARSGAVLMSAATRRLVRGSFRCERLESCPLACCDKPFEIYRVLEKRSTARKKGTEVELVPFLGREAELALLRERFEQAAKSRAWTVLVCGEAGSGKTRLVRTFRGLVGAGSRAWLGVSCRPAAPSATLGQLLSRALGCEGEEEPGVWVRCLTNRAASGASVVAIDDVHLAGASDLELLGQLIDQARAARLLILLTCRPPFDPPWKPLPGSTVLSLGGLGAGEVKRMIHHLAAGRALGTAAEERILAAADGVPRFVEELTRTLLGTEALKDAVPGSLNSWLTACLDRLGDAREVARVASVLGREFTRAQLSALLPAAGDAVDRGLDRLVEAEILKRRGGRWRAAFRFRHGLIRDAAYESLIGEHRRLYQQRAAAAFPGAQESSSSSSRAASRSGSPTPSANQP